MYKQHPEEPLHAKASTLVFIQGGLRTTTSSPPPSRKLWRK